MRVVVDANIVISALIVDGATRALLIGLDHDYLTPVVVHDELDDHREMIAEKSGLSQASVEQLVSTLFKYVAVVPDQKIQPYLDMAHEAIGDTDADDVPYLATALGYDAAVWSDDGDFDEQNLVPVYGTTEFIRRFGGQALED